MSWLKEAVSDTENRADMAYLCIGVLALAAVLSLFFICTMSAVSYSKCMPTLTIENQISIKDQADSSADKRHIVPCVFDPLPVGQAVGLVFGAFAALIGSLAGYMAATRRKEKAP